MEYWHFIQAFKEALPWFILGDFLIIMVIGSLFVFLDGMRRIREKH